MTNDAPTLFEMPPALPKVGSYGMVGATPAKIIRYEDNMTVVVVERWVAGNHVEERYSTSVFETPQPLTDAAPSRRSFGIVIEADTRDQVEDTFSKLKTALGEMGVDVEESQATSAGIAGAPMPKRELEIKILRQVIDGGDQDHHERALAGLLNDGWKIMKMKSCRNKGARTPSMLVVIYLKRWTVAPVEPTPEDAAEAVQNVPSPMPAPEPVPAPIPPAPVEEPTQPVAVVRNLHQAKADHDALLAGKPTKKPLDEVTFMEALATDLYSADELMEIGDRQGRTAGREDFVNYMMARRDQMPMLNLPVLPPPVSIPA